MPYLFFYINHKIAVNKIINHCVFLASLKFTLHMPQVSENKPVQQTAVLTNRTKGWRSNYFSSTFEIVWDIKKNQINNFWVILHLSSTKICCPLN